MDLSEVKKFEAKQPLTIGGLVVPEPSSAAGTTAHTWQVMFKKEDIDAAMKELSASMEKMVAESMFSIPLPSPQHKSLAPSYHARPEHRPLLLAIADVLDRTRPDLRYEQIRERVSGGEFEEKVLERGSIRDFNVLGRESVAETCATHRLRRVRRVCAVGKLLAEMGEAWVKKNLPDDVNWHIVHLNDRYGLSFGEIAAQLRAAAR